MQLHGSKFTPKFPEGDSLHPMKNRIYSAITVAALLFAFLPTAFAQSVPYAVYGQWRLTSQTTVAAAGSVTIALQPCYVSAGTLCGDRQFFRLATHVQVARSLTAANTETVWHTLSPSPLLDWPEMPRTVPSIPCAGCGRGKASFCRVNK